MIYKNESEVAQSCLTLCNPMDSSLPGSAIMGFSRQEYWSGLPFPSPGNLPNLGIEPGSPALQTDALPSEPLGKPKALINLIFLPTSAASPPHQPACTMSSIFLSLSLLLVYFLPQIIYSLFDCFLYQLISLL